MENRKFEIHEHITEECVSSVQWCYCTACKFNNTITYLFFILYGHSKAKETVG